MSGIRLDMPWLLAILLAIALVIGWMDFWRRRRALTAKPGSEGMGPGPIVHAEQRVDVNHEKPWGAFRLAVVGGALIVISVWVNFFWLNFLAVVLGVLGLWQSNRSMARIWVRRAQTDLDRAGSAWGLFWSVVTALGCTVVSGFGAYLFILGLVGFLGF